MSDRIDPTGTRRPTPGQESAALRILADLAEVGGLIPNKVSGWTAVPLMAGTEAAERRTIVAGMRYVEAYRGTDRDAGLRVWRGRLCGWPLAVSEFDPDNPTSVDPTNPTPARMGLARVLAEYPPTVAQVVDLAAARSARAAVDARADHRVDHQLRSVWNTPAPANLTDQESNR